MTVYKMTEIVGTSGTSISDAIRGAIERASVTLDDLQWFEVKEIRGRMNEGEVAEFQVRLDIGFTLHAPEKETGATGTARQDKTQRGRTRQARSLQAQVAAKRGAKAQRGIARSFRDQPRKKR